MARRWRPLAIALYALMLFALMPGISWSQTRSFYYQQILTPSIVNDPDNLFHPTVVTLAPDGRLFVAQQNGRIYYVTLNANFGIVPGSLGRIDTIYNLAPPSGSPPGSTYPGGRQVTGMTFGPNGDLFVSHSDVRMHNLAIDPVSGKVSRLLASEGFAIAHDIVTNLPRSTENHSSNGLAFKPGTNLLYLAQGGMTNAGLVAGFYGPAESALSACIIEIDITTGAHSCFATGFRNPYSLLWHSNGKLYATDNGPNHAAGDTTTPNCGDSGSGVDAPDELNWVQQGHYYGHPNPDQTRQECIFQGGDAPIHQYGYFTSSDGIAEYTSNALPGLTGQIITANYANSNKVVAVSLSANGQTANPLERAIRLNITDPLSVAVRSSDGAIFVAQYGTLAAAAVSVLRVRTTPPVDIDNDRVTDIAMYDPSTATWYLRNSSTGSSPNPIPWYNIGSYSGDIPRTADFDGDGKADLVSWRPSDGHWRILLTSSNFTTSLDLAYGSPQMIPTPADFDGDGFADIILYDPTSGIWYIRNTATGASSTAQFANGLTGGLPRPIDIDGDGKIDLAVFLPTGHWHILLSSTGYNPATELDWSWGSPGMTPAPADYDGDGITDVAVFDPTSGNWYVRYSSTGNGVQYNNWGTSADIVRPGDWDGDGKADLARWSTADGHWRVLLSTTGYNPAPGVALDWSFGSPGMIPVFSNY